MGEVKKVGGAYIGNFRGAHNLIYQDSRKQKPFLPWVETI